jgi:hypothetical protein
MPRQPDTGSSWWKRLGWFALIWACSVSALGLAAYGMRLLMKFAGLTAG